MKCSIWLLNKALLYSFTAVEYNVIGSNKHSRTRTIKRIAKLPGLLDQKFVQYEKLK